MNDSKIRTLRSPAFLPAFLPVSSRLPAGLARGLSNWLPSGWAAIAVPILAAITLAMMTPWTPAWAGEHTLPPPTGLIVLAAGDLRGEIEPCGCSAEGQMGGLPRRLSYLEQQGLGREDAPILLDLGNNFPDPTRQGRLKIALIENLLARFPPDAILPGPSEFAAGLEGLDTSLPYLLSNDALGNSFAPVRTVMRTIARTLRGKNHRIGLFGYLSPALVYQGSQSRFRLEEAHPALLEKFRRSLVRERHDIAVLLFRGGNEELAIFVESGLFALIVAGNPSPDELRQITGRKLAGGRIPQVPTKGQGLLRMSLPLEPPASAMERQKPEQAKYRVDWLKENWPDHADAAPVFQRYNREVKGLFFARLETMERQKRDSRFAGAKACQACHAVEEARWRGSRHAGAWNTLERVGKQFDPECLACHVVGLGRGGFLSKDLTPALAGVQCENCHGPGKAHAAQPASKTGPPPPIPTATGTPSRPPTRRPDERTCRTCHVGSHSPSFSFPIYWPKIRHP